MDWRWSCERKEGKGLLWGGLVNEIKGERGWDNRMTTKKEKRKDGMIGGRKQKKWEEGNKRKRD